MAELAYSITETAKKLGCGKDTVYAMVRQNQIPNKRIGPRRWIIPRTALEEWLMDTHPVKIEQPKTVARPAFSRVQNITGIKHPAVKPGCGGRKRKAAP
jgi:excisionase family DNA binding protein